MSTKEKLLEALNEVQSWELTGFIQYTQHGLLVSGPLRETYREFFGDLAEEAHQHMGLVGDKIVALGGVPTIEHKTVRQETQLMPMLEADVELEKTALEAYLTAWEVAKELGHRPTIFWLEERISEEQLHVDELSKLLRSDASVAAALGERKSA